MKLSVKHGAQARYPEAWFENGTHEERAQQRYQVQFNPWLFAPEAEKLLLEAGVEIMFDTLICSAEVENGRITHVIAENKGGRCAVKAKSFVDATGEAAGLAAAMYDDFAKADVSAIKNKLRENGIKLHISETLSE